MDALELEDLGFEVPDAVEGRPPYACDLLLKVWPYGYLNRIRSSRKLETACWEHMSLIWLTGAHYPDHNTLWRFWAGNRKALREVFRQAVFVACKADLVGLVLHAVDGTKIAADVSWKKLWRRRELSELLVKLDVAIDEVMQEVEGAQEAAGGDYRLPDGIRDAWKRREKIREALGELKKVEWDYLHPHDTEARMMKDSHGTVLAFNAQVVVDQKSGLIVAQDVVNEESDNGQLVPMVETARCNLGAATEETVADAGYYAPGQLAQAEAKGLSVVVAMLDVKNRRWGKGEFQKSNFRYDEKTDACTCPLGKRLGYERTKRDCHDRYWMRIYRCHGYDDCPRRLECSHVKWGREIDRGEYEGAVERQQTKQDDNAKRELLRKRKAIVEHVFVQIKEHQGFRRWGLRGLENAKTQWAVLCTAYNLRKLHRYWAEGGLVVV